MVHVFMLVCFFYLTMTCSLANFMLLFFNFFIFISIWLLNKFIEHVYFLLSIEWDWPIPLMKAFCRKLCFSPSPLIPLFLPLCFLSLSSKVSVFVVMCSAPSLYTKAKFLSKSFTTFADSCWCSYTTDVAYLILAFWLFFLIIFFPHYCWYNEFVDAPSPYCCPRVLILEDFHLH